jgi:quinol monooxygenase YgiN
MSEAHVVVLARWRVREGEQDTVERLVRAVATASRQEPGCLEYRVHRARAEPRVLVLFERYASEAALEAHRASAHFQGTVLGEIVPRLESREVVLLDELPGD